MDWIPVRCVRWDKQDNGRVVLYKPKFRRKWLTRLALRLGKQPDCHLHLDENGSIVWMACDGKRTVWQICQSFKDQTGAPDRNLPQRTMQFLQSLLKRDCIRFQKTG